ncbi:MAG: Trp family transcriptional regulator [Spirochaetota bacterium]
MKAYDEMIETLCEVNDAREMKQLLTELLTDAELQDLILRWTLLRQLAEGVHQREIAKNLGISLCKITRGAKILKDEKSMLYSILKGAKKP